MWRALFVVALGCGSSHQVLDAARTDPAVCVANREAALDRSCTVPADCVLVASEDCCGTIKLGVKAGTEAGFPGVEATYEACLACPPLGCAHQDEAEDGTVPQAGQAIVATCATGHCKAIVQ
jgi:hypothetical protein